MAASIILFIVLLGVSAKLSDGSPVNRSTLEKYLTGMEKRALGCDVEGDFESPDPCKPMCVCRKGRVICAEEHCTDNYEAPPKSFCSKLHVAGRCCHHYLCVAEDGTGTMFYPLPVIDAPDELYEESR